MSAVGAPPPPPPPPPPPSYHCATIEDLPAELLLMIYKHIGLGVFMNLALAIYPTLQQHGLVPDLTSDIVDCIENDWHGTFVGDTLQSAVSRIPRELWWQIAGYLEPIDLMRLVFAVGSRFYYFQDTPSKETLERLRIWARRLRKR